MYICTILYKYCNDVIITSQENSRPLNPTDPGGSDVTIQSSLDLVLSRIQRPKNCKYLSLRYLAAQCFGLAHGNMCMQFLCVHYEEVPLFKKSIF